MITIPLGDHTVAALTWGPTDGPLALLLHGFPDSAATWRLLGPALAARGWRVVAPYSRGYAPTGPAPDGGHQLGALVADVVAIHRALAADRRAVLIGHDWGAIVANGVSAHAPTLFSSVVMLAAPPPRTVVSLLARPARLPVVARQARRSWYAAAIALPLVATLLGDRLIRVLWRSWSTHDHGDDLAAALRALPDRRHRRAAFAYYRTVWNPLRRNRKYADQQRAAVRGGRVRTLYLHGADDRCAVVGLGEDALRHLPDGSRRVVVDRAGHFLHLDRPAQVAAEVVRFIG